MYYVYVIYSPSHNRYYKGLTQDIEKRLREHNQGHTRSTKAFKPWVLVYHETFADIGEARKREKYFKTAAGRRYLRDKTVP